MHNKSLILVLIMIVTVLGLMLAMGLPVYAQSPPDEQPGAESSSQQGSRPEEGLPPSQAESVTTEEAGSTSQKPEAPPAEEESPAVVPSPEEEIPASSNAQSESSEDEPCEEDVSEEETLAAEPVGEARPFGLEINPSAVVVYDYSELKKALEGDNGYITVYLGANIAADSSGIALHANKANVVIDGSPPGGERYTFTQYTSADAAAVIRVATASVQSVTLRNMDIVGGNHYGVVMVANSVPGVTLVHENVSYTGPQAFYNRGGTVCAMNSTYTLQPTAGQRGELAEAKHAQFGGVVNITAHRTENSVLWLTGGASDFTVLEGAQVTVDTDFYFVFYDGTPPNITIGQGASFSLASGRFGFTYASQHVASFLVAAGANLAINLNTTESYAALRVAGLFQMDPGSSATIVRTGTAGIALRLTGAGAQAVFNQPRRVFLYSSAGVPMRFTGAGTLSITTSALNVWQSISWPLAGGVNPLPTHIWNKVGSQLLALTATYSTEKTQSLVSNLAADDPVISTLDAKSFNLEGSQLVAFGAMALSLDTPTGQSTVLTGSTLPGAALLAAYTLVDDKDGEMGGAADALGHYALPVKEGKLKVGSSAAVVAGENGLAMRQSAVVQDGGAGKLSFLSVPQQLHFGSVPVPGGKTLVQRQDATFALAVFDGRYSVSPWRIDVSLPQPLTAVVNGTFSRLTDAVVFQAGGGTPLALNEAPMTIYRQNSGVPGEYTVQWGNGEGILLNISPGEIYSGVAYTTAIHWQLVDAP